jgi:hypothetical protein
MAIGAGPAYRYFTPPDFAPGVDEAPAAQLPPGFVVQPR